MPAQSWQSMDRRYKEAKELPLLKSGGENKSWEHRQASEVKAAYCSRPRVLSTAVGVGRAGHQQPLQAIPGPTSVHAG